ncbi:MAG: hypothetical protein Q9225_001583 [Loekoesia sp. 1 TL-2023]
MTAYGDQRLRSPAFQGAQHAFSSPSAAQRSPNNTSNGSHGALVAATRVGTGNWGPTGNDRTTSNKLHVQKNAAAKQRDDAISYVAANLAAQLSTERLPNSIASPSLPNQQRPATSRSHSDISVRPMTNLLPVSALISRYDRIDHQASRNGNTQDSSGKRVTLLDTVGNPPVHRPVRAIATSKNFESRDSSILSRASSSSSGTSSYTSAVGQPPRQYQSMNVHDAHISLDLPLNPASRPAKNYKTATGSNVGKGIERQRSQILLDHTIPQLSVDSLANAMVASSLASSRVPSPTRPPLPPPRRRSRPHLFHRTRSADEAGSRTPSPSKGAMRTTMRAPLDPDQDLAMKHKSKRFINKHPNKHHEGDRKRWRDQITEFERKRYEGVWAANKGLLTSTYQKEPSLSVDIPNSVLNLVVRDVWSRSRLPSDVLEEIWDLVDVSRTGLLSKEEFVVGTWLVDQRLKGRKIPVMVSDSVWFSARGLTGIKQDQLNETNTIVECTDHPVWFRSWTVHTQAKYFEAACVRAWQNMISIDIVPHGTEKFEFLSENASPGPASSKYKPMRTPRRYTASADGKLCTMVVAMLKDIPPTEIPLQPKGPLVSREVVSYQTLNRAISNIFQTCLRKKGDDAKFGCARPGTPQLRGILALVMASDSQIDRDIPPGPEPQTGSTATS